MGALSLWIESHVQIKDHPKTHKLMAAAGVDLPAAVGYLHLLWWWTAMYCRGGRVLSCPAEIEIALSWRGKPGELVDALVKAGWLDRERKSKALKVHDWNDHGGRLENVREQAAERMRTLRERSANVRRTCRGPDLTGPDRTRSDRTGPDLTGSESDLPHQGSLSPPPPPASTKLPPRPPELPRRDVFTAGAPTFGDAPAEYQPRAGESGEDWLRRVRDQKAAEIARAKANGAPAPPAPRPKQPRKSFARRRRAAEVQAQDDPATTPPTPEAP